MTHRLLPRAPACALRRSLLALVLAGAASAAVPPRAGAAAASAVPTSGGWDATQQRQVLAAGLMEASAGSFDGAGQLAAPAANASMAALATWLQSRAQANQQALPGPPSAGEEPVAAVVPAVAVAHTGESPVTVAGFDRMLVEELGLGAVAARVQATTVAAGLQPPTGSNTEALTARALRGACSRSRGSRGVGRFAAGQLEPGDLLFFGSAHFNSKATERNIIHEGIYLGEDWVIHSSGQGVYVLPLTGSWLGSSFAWGRRVIP